MEQWCWILAIIVFGLLLGYWGYRRDMEKLKVECALKHFGSPKLPEISERYTPRHPRFITTSQAPPLPISTMTEIRIGREVVRRGGPSDPVWNYDHSRGVGANY